MSGVWGGIVGLEDYQELTPALIENFAKAGRESATRLLCRQKDTGDNGAILPAIELTAAALLVKKFTLCYETCFIPATRDNPYGSIPGDAEKREMEPYDRRWRLMMSVQAAAALCFIADKIQQLPGSERATAEAAIQDDVKPFYQACYITGEIDPGVSKWIIAVLKDNAKLTDAQKEARGLEILEALRPMITRTSVAPRFDVAKAA